VVPLKFIGRSISSFGSVLLELTFLRARGKAEMKN
jgi:hypothetical protein